MQKGGAISLPSRPFDHSARPLAALTCILFILGLTYVVKSYFFAPYKNNTLKKKGGQVNFTKLCCFSINILVCLLTFFIASCTNEEVRVAPQTEERSAPKNFAQVVAENTESEQKKKVVEGMLALRQRDYQRASQIFNDALNNDPTNSGLHTLNGLAYQMLGKDGDYASYDLAEVGYTQAKKFNPTNTIAALQLGRVKAEKRNFVGAQEEFAEVLLFDPSNRDALYELASVSYLAGDVKTARMSVDQLLKHDRTNPKYVRAGALIYAVHGNKAESQKLLDCYKKLESNQEKAVFLERRLNDWFQLHASGSIILASTNGTPSPQAAVVASQLPPIVDTPDAQKKANAENAATAAKKAEILEKVAAEIVASPQSNEPAPAPGASPNAPPKELLAEAPMFIMDAVVMRVIEEADTVKGNNILNNLQLSLAPFSAYDVHNAGGAIRNVNLFPLNNISTASPTNFLSPGITSLTGVVDSIIPTASKHASVFTSAISFGTINYALNIANATRQHIYIIGRPMLTGFIGKTSSFFTGAELNIALQGTLGGGTITKTPTGSTLEITPLSIDKDGYITMEVKITDSFLEETEASIAARASQLTPLVFGVDLSNISTTVKIKRGETMMIGGTVQRTEINNNTGFPGLKDLPIIQYFFSQDRTISVHESVQYIITPRTRKTVRKAARDYINSINECDYEDRPSVEELANRHGDWLKPPENVVPILKSLKPLYHDYRTGDISPLQWGIDQSWDEKLTEISSFMWY